MIAMCEQWYWMHEGSYYCGPHIGCQFVTVFVSFYMETYLMHWTHRIDDTNTLDVDGYYYSFNSPMVRIQYNKRGYLRGCLKNIRKRRSKRPL